MEQQNMDTKLQSPAQSRVEVNSHGDCDLSDENVKQSDECSDVPGTIQVLNDGETCRNGITTPKDQEEPTENQPLLQDSSINTPSVPLSMPNNTLGIQFTSNSPHICQIQNNLEKPNVNELQSRINTYSVLNEKNIKNKSNVPPLGNVYENPVHVSTDTDNLLERHNCKINSVTNDCSDDEKPPLRVQFNGKNITANSPDFRNHLTVSEDISPNSSSESSSSSSSSESLEITEARPPDGGWGWVIVLASFVVNLIADGITFSFGVIFVEFLKYFGQNKSNTAWIGSLFMAMPLLSGPVASFLTDRYGCRRVTIFGSILACIGFIISSTANSMTVLCLTFGGLAGFGLSLCYVASVVIVAYYFDKKRSFATGLAVCGSGIGTFIFAPLIHALLTEYGWRGTTLILAGLFLNLAVCGALMRDLPWTSAKMKSLAKERKRNRNMKRRNKGSSADSFSVSNSTNTASMLQTIPETNEDESKEGNPDRLSSSLVNLPTYVRNGERVPMEVIELLSQHKNVYNVLMTNYPNMLTPSKSFSDSGKLNEAHLAKTTQSLSEAPPSGREKNLRREDAVYNCFLKRNQRTPPRSSPKKQNTYLKDLRVHRLSLTYRGAMLNINRYRLRASSCPDIYRNSMTTIAKEKLQWYAGLWDLWDIVVDMFDFSHFLDPKFTLFVFSNFLLYKWYDVPYVYLTDSAIKMGYSEDKASLLISIIGIFNMVGEIMLGWAGDRSWADPGIIYAICMGFCGGVCALIPLVDTYWGLCVMAGGFGFFIAANYALTCIILVELISLDRFTNAYGLLLLVQGVANLIGPPIGGWLYDITDKYDLSFYLAGLFIALSGLLLVIIPATRRYKKFQGLQRQVSSEASIEGDSSPKEPGFHKILVSCITGNVDKPNIDNVSHI